jgi:hypothetical protein
MGGENGLVFATEGASGTFGNLTKDLALGIDNPPFAFHLFGLG